MTELKPIDELLPRPRSKRLSPDDAVLSPTEELVIDLVRIGVGLRKAEFLVDRYPAEQIRRQLEWLPQRRAKRPASLLIASIEHDYDAPAYAKE